MEPALAVFVHLEHLGRLVGHLVIPRGDAIAADDHLSARVWLVGDHVAALGPVGQLRLYPVERNANVTDAQVIDSHAVHTAAGFRCTVTLGRKYNR